MAQKLSRAKDLRGSNADRRARKLWLLSHYGDGELTTCFRCAVPLDYETVTADRIDPGAFGGRYIRENLRPACQPCQTETGNEIGQKLRQFRETVLEFHLLDRIGHNTSTDRKKV